MSSTSNGQKDKETGTKEEIAIKQLKGRIQDVIFEHEQFDDDFYLLQWLKVQKLHVQKAETMLRASIAWRKGKYVDYDNLLDDELPSDIANIIKINFDGVTRTGAPDIHFGQGSVAPGRNVFIVDSVANWRDEKALKEIIEKSLEILILSLKPGGMDFRGVVEKYGRERYIRYWVQVFAKAEKLMMDYNKKTGEKNKGQPITSKSATGIYGVMDFANYSIKQTQSIQTIQSQIEILKILGNYYPGIFGHGFIINASRFFFLAFKAVKPFLEGPCLTIQIFDTNEEQWKSAITELIDPSELSPDFGGTKTDTPS